jgi:small multidrug resistance pump
VIWLLLVAAILIEVCASLGLRTASRGRPRWYAGVIVGYTTALGLLSIALRMGLNLGIAYGIWTASGVALTAVASYYLFDEPLTKLMMVGLVLIMAGVLLVETGAHGG